MAWDSTAAQSAENDALGWRLDAAILPLAHSFGKVCELIAVSLGVPTAVEGDIDALLDGIQHTVITSYSIHYTKLYESSPCRSYSPSGEPDSPNMSSTPWRFTGTGKLSARMAETNENEIHLRALEREAEANRQLLQTLLAREKEIGAQDRFELQRADARVISYADPPNKSSRNNFV